MAGKQTKADIKADESQEKKSHKITDIEFWAAMRLGFGNYAKVARIIEKKHNIKYTRQSVKAKADQNPDAFADVKEELKDLAEATLQELMITAPPNVRLEAATRLLKSQAKERGWGEKPLEISATAEQEAEEQAKPMGGGLRLTIKVLKSNE